MHDILIQLARGSGPIPGAIATVAGGVLGGAGFLSASGALLGAIAGLGLLGALSPIAAFIARLTGQSLAQSLAHSLSMPGIPAMSGVAAAAAQVAPANFGQAGSTIMAMAVPPSSGGPATPAEGAAPAAEDAPTETEAQLLNSGRFDEYHLAKAKRLFEAKQFKEAAYQAGASLCHGDLPEAVAIRKAALAAMK